MLNQFEPATLNRLYVRSRYIYRGGLATNSQHRFNVSFIETPKKQIDNKNWLLGVTVAVETEFKDKKKKLILPTQKPYDKDLPNNICYQRHKTTFGIVSILVL